MSDRPEQRKPGFECPFCGHKSGQSWAAVWIGTEMTGNTPEWEAQQARLRVPRSFARNDIAATKRDDRGLGLRTHHEIVTRTVKITASLDAVGICRCLHCDARSVWIAGSMVWPRIGAGVPPPHEALNDGIKRDYDEARSILDLFPRGAAALLRVCVEKLCAQLEAKGRRLDDRIADLVARGLPERVQQAMDLLRVTGNDAVHPLALMDVRDNRETAASLFQWVNLIAEQMITLPAQMKAAYDSLPPGKLQEIEKRNDRARRKRDQGDSQ